MLLSFTLRSQTFTRSELPTILNTPWEMTYGPDGFLWITEKGGKVLRVDPINGNKSIVYTAPDYFAGSPLEQSPLCFQPNIGVGTLGLALHPDFMNASTSFVYFLYSYNSGSSQVPGTKFKVERLTWNASTGSVTSHTTIVPLLPTGYDHLGGRLISVKQNSVAYLFVSIGDNGISEDNSPDCYGTQANNPNNYAQDPNFKNGKIHRFNIDGSIPADNPKSGNSFYTRGHRNPQGLIYNYSRDIVYNLEHGDRTDDEINLLEAGKNYGWKYVRGYHSDNNFPGEAAFVNGYVADPTVLNDGLKEAFYSWCAVPQPTASNNADWCTVAPSDGIYYGVNGIPEWTNSLLVVTLKNGATTDTELYQFKLNTNGLGLAPSTAEDPNPRRYFATDQALNGRLRDIAVSADGTKIFLINNGGSTRDKITIYSYIPSSKQNPILNAGSDPMIFPNPANNEININSLEKIESIEFRNLIGETVKTLIGNVSKINVDDISDGAYIVTIKNESGNKTKTKFIKN